MIFKAKAISPAKLIDSINNGRHLTHNQVTDVMLDKHVETLRQIENWDDEAMKQTTLLSELVEPHLSKFITIEAQKKLLQCHVFVVPLPYIGAYSEADPNTIVIGSGFIDYLAAYLYLGVAADSLPKELSEARHPNYPNTPVRDLIPLLFTGLLYLHLKCGDPLPNYRALLSENIDEQLKHSLTGALTFILFHELGHLVLGHHNVDQAKVRLVDLPFQIPEELSKYKLQELEADSFARDCMLKDYRPLYPSWVETALGPHSMLETLLSSNIEYHPICINRLIYAQYSSDDQIDRTVYLEGLERSAKKYQSIKDNNEALESRGERSILERMTRDKIQSLLVELNCFVQGYSIDLTEIMLKDSPKWDELIH